MLDDEHLKTAVENSVTCPDCVNLLRHLIEKSGCFRTGLARDDRLEIYNRGWGDFGLYIRQLLLEYAPEVYIKIIKKGVEENGNRNNNTNEH